MKGSKRKISPNGDGGVRLSLPPSVVKALGLLNGDIVIVDVVEGGNFLQKEIRIKKFDAHQQELESQRPF